MTSARVWIGGLKLIAGEVCMGAPDLNSNELNDESNVGNEEAIADAICNSSTDIFYTFLCGLLRSGWTGSIRVDQGEKGKRTVFLHEGSFVFAESDHMDERLGDVAYRHGLLTLDQLTQVLVKVNNELSFEAAVVKEGVWDYLSLQRAREIQVRDIISAIFFEEGVYFELNEKVRSEFTVTMHEKSASFAKRIYSLAYLYRKFMVSVNPNAKLSLASSSTCSLLMETDFRKDFAVLVDECETVDELLDRSSMSKENSLRSLFYEIQWSRCELEPMPVLSLGSNASTEEVMEQINRYAHVLSLAKTYCKDANVMFDLSSLSQYAASLSHHRHLSIVLDENGYMTSASMSYIMGQCYIDAALGRSMKNRIDSVTCFLVSMTQAVLNEKDWQSFCNELSNLEKITA